MNDIERQVRELFLSDVERPQSEWEAFLAASEAAPEVRARVESLLAHHSTTHAFLSRPAADTFATLLGTAPEQIAEFQVIREIGRGGMGAVYLAEDTDLKRSVALKILSYGHEHASLLEGRFRTEAQAIARLSHPGIVQIYRTGREQNYSYIAMEYVEGENLRNELERLKAAAPPPPPRTNGAAVDRTVHRIGREQMIRFATLASEVAEALDHAHRHKVIHRDVKPSNVLIDKNGRARLTDFGVARITSEVTLSRPDDIMGSYPYMSPEQARVQTIEVDHRSDIFSLGVVLYEMLTLERPFDGESPQAIIKALSEATPARVRRINPFVPRDLETICHKAIEKLPHDRYQTAGQLAADLQAFLQGQPILAAPPNVVRRSTRWVKRHRRGFAVASTAGSVVLIVGLLVYLKDLRDDRMAWLEIEPGTPSILIVQPVDPDTHLLQPPQRPLTLADGRRVPLPPGHYRMTIVRSPVEPDSPFAELDLLLMDTGVERTQRLQVIGADDPMVIDGDRLQVRLRSVGPLDIADMLSIESGTHDVGMGIGNDALRRRLQAPLAKFHIDQREVSNAEYLEFLLATASSAEVRNRLESIRAGRDLDPSETPAASPNSADAAADRHHHPHTPDYWKTEGFPAGFENHPVVGVRLGDAEAFARWRGKRLPTRFEWEVAARGRTRPTSNESDFPGGQPIEVLLERLGATADPGSAAGRYLIPGERYLRADQARDTATLLIPYRELSVPVDAGDPVFPVAAMYHAFGNVREITSTVDLTHLDGVAMGRSWLDDPGSMPLSYMVTFPLTERSFDRGFRCARSAAPPTLRP